MKQNSEWNKLYMVPIQLSKSHSTTFQGRTTFKMLKYQKQLDLHITVDLLTFLVMIPYDFAFRSVNFAGSGNSIVLPRRTHLLRRPNSRILSNWFKYFQRLVVNVSKVQHVKFREKNNEMWSEIEPIMTTVLVWQSCQSKNLIEDIFWIWLATSWACDWRLLCLFTMKLFLWVCNNCRHNYKYKIHAMAAPSSQLAALCLAFADGLM